VFDVVKPSDIFEKTINFLITSKLKVKAGTPF